MAAATPRGGQKQRQGQGQRAGAGTEPPAYQNQHRACLCSVCVGLHDAVGAHLPMNMKQLMGKVTKMRHNVG